MSKCNRCDSLWEIIQRERTNSSVAISRLMRVVEAARYVNGSCDYDVRSGPQEYPHDDVCSFCEMKAALTEIEGEND